MRHRIKRWVAAAVAVVLLAACFYGLSWQKVTNFNGTLTVESIRYRTASTASQEADALFVGQYDKLFHKLTMSRYNLSTGELETTSTFHIPIEGTEEAVAAQASGGK